MKNYYSLLGSNSQRFMKDRFIWILTFIFLLTYSVSSQAQCTGGSCNFTISTNGNVSIPAGQTYCLQKNNYNGTITFGAGSVLCIGTGITWNNAVFTFSGATGTINNYGTSNASFTLPNGYTFNNNGTYSGTLTQNSGSAVNNSGTFSGSLTENGGTFTNNSAGTINSSNFSTSAGSTLINNGTLTYSGGNIAGTFITGSTGTTNMTVNAQTSGTGIIVQGILNYNAGTLGGTVTVSPSGRLNIGSSNGNAIVSDSGTVVVNSGINASETFTVNNGGTLTNNGTLQGGSVLTGNAGSTITNNGMISNNVVTTGNFTNSSGATIQGTFTENAGGSVTNSGNMQSGATVNGGSFTNSSTGSISNGGGLNVTGGTVTNNGNLPGGLTVSGGSVNNTSTISSNVSISGGSVTNTGTMNGNYNQTGGAVTNASGGTMTPINPTFGGGSITNSAGGTLNLPNGGNNIFQNGFTLTNNGTLNTSGPITVNAGATLNLQGTQNISGSQLTDNGTINLAGSLTVSTYTGNGTFNEISSGCNIFTTGSNTGSTTFNGGNSTYGGGLIVNTAGGSMINGAGATITAPTQQPTALSIPLTGSTVNGSFTSPSASIAGYIVLRFIGLAAPSDNPSNYATYTVGSTIGSSTVAAIIPSSATGTRTFTDNIPGGNCGKNIYYRIFSYNGAGTCRTFDVTGPLTGSVAIPAASTSITASGPTTFCAGGSVNLTATGGGTYAWSTSATTATITVSASGTYTVTTTSTSGCTVTASQVVTVNPIPTAAISPSGPSAVCAGGSLTLTASGGGTYAWSTGATTAAISPTVSAATTYTVTVTASGCTATASRNVTINAAPTPSVTSASFCPGASATITATGGTSYSWSNGTSGATLTSSTAATYTVTATNASGCTATASGTISAAPVPTVTAGSNSPVTSGSAINLTSSPSAGTAPFTYSWSGPASFSSTGQNPTVASATYINGGTYTITATDNLGCTATANTSVNVSVAVAPGGMGNNLALWVKANSLSQTNGSLVSTWTNSAGGNSPAQPVILNQPIFYNTSTDYINYYPVVSFNGINQEMQSPSFSGTNTYSQAHVFVVSKAVNNTQSSSVVYENQATVGGESGRINVHLPWSGAAYWDAGTCCTNNRASATFPATYSGVPKLWSFSKDLSGTANGTQQQDIRANGVTIATKNTNTGFTGNGSTFYLGSGGGGSYYNGEVAEVIYYLGATINAAAQNKIESYLALKYGITLDQTTAQNYTSSTGLTFWSAAANGAFNKNIFGTGIDNGSGLSQTQSQSINTNILTISNTTGLTNNSFFVVSDSGGTNNLYPRAGLPNTINASINNTWRVSNTGTATAETFVYNKSTVNYGYYSSLSSSLVPYMLIDANADGIFESYVPATTIIGSNISFNASLADGARFTFGFKASIDYGDAWGVPTTIANNGAAHVIVSGVRLGALIDAEVDGQPSVNAAGDDTLGLADEDGVDFNIGVATNNQNILQIGITNSIKVTASTAGFLDAWIDYNHDNTYGGGSEYAIIKVPLVAGVNVVNFNISDSVLYGGTSMRFRFAQNIGDVTGPTGLALNGEVEDYKVYVTAPLVSACTNGFQNPSFEMGPYPSTYIITNQSNVHYWRTTAPDQQIEVWNSGFNGVPSYSGQYFVELNANMPGALYQDVYTTPGTVVIWKFAHRGRAGVDSCNLKIGAPGATITKKVVGDGTTAWGVYSGAYTVPANQYITRFEFNALYAVGGLSVGNFIDDMSVSTSFDFGDAPNSYGTLKSSNGPYHAMTGNLRLGANVSCDADGQPSATATLDSYDDGVTFPPVCNTCSSYSVSVSVYNNSGLPATIAGWIDFNKNGVFDATERASVTVPSSTLLQTVTITFNTTLSMLSPAVNGKLYARFRVANDSTEVALPTGLATSGEVEDYLVPCSVTLPLPVPSSNSPVCAGSTLNLTTTTTAGAYYFWAGPNGFTASGSTASRTNINLVDSGMYRVYSVYANGCETDSAITRVVVNQCYMNISGSIFDDANGDGVINGTDAASSLGQSIYAVLVDTTSNTVLVSSSVAANGTFTIVNAPAYRTGMRLISSTTNPSVGSAAPAASWPNNWVGTKGQYGTNNLAGTGLYSTPSQIPVSSNAANITGILIGYDRLPTTTVKTYSIPYPHANTIKSLTTANGMGPLAGADPEDGAFGVGSTFTITSLSGMNGNTLYYDANGDGILQPYEQILGYTTITNFDPNKLIIKFTGAGSVQAAFNYGISDAASQVTPAPAAYTIKWIGTLPVKMLYFNADKKDNDKSLLTWATASEIDNDHFEIERSADAQVWDNIGQVKGSGTTSEQHDYSFTDAQPLSGVNYYRLKQVDIDGHFEYSEIVEVEFSGISSPANATLSVYPNPLSKNTNLNIELAGGADEMNEISITNTIGQVVYNTTVSQVQNYQISGLDLPAGVYVISIKTQSEKHISSRLVIAK